MHFGNISFDQFNSFRSLQPISRLVYSIRASSRQNYRYGNMRQNKTREVGITARKVDNQQLSKTNLKRNEGVVLLPSHDVALLQVNMATNQNVVDCSVAPKIEKTRHVFTVLSHRKSQLQKRILVTFIEILLLLVVQLQTRLLYNQSKRYLTGAKSSQNRAF